VLTPHTEGHTSGRFADPSRVDKTLVPIETLHGTQPAVEVSVAADFSALIDECSNIHMHHEHQPSQTSSVVLPFVIDPNFINNFNTFYDEFVQSPTYARAHLDDNNSAYVDDDNNDDDDTLMDTHDATMTSTHRLRLALRELAKVNRHLFNILENLLPAPYNDPSPAPTVQPLPCADPMQQPKPCPEPPRDCAPQYVIRCAPPPAPDPVAIPLQHQAPPIDGISCIAPEKSPHAPTPDTTSTHCRPTWHTQSTLQSIPNWAKPVVPPLATPMVGVDYADKTHWPPPRPPKSAPFKKKPQIKPALVICQQEKDSLRPP